MEQADVAMARDRITEAKRPQQRSTSGWQVPPASRRASPRPGSRPRSRSRSPPAWGWRIRPCCTPSPDRGADRRFHAGHRPAFPRDARDPRAQRAALRHAHPRAGARRGRVEALVARDGLFGFRLSVEARKACCDVRKVRPLRRALGRRCRPGSRDCGASNRPVAARLPSPRGTRASTRSRSTRWRIGRWSASRPTSRPTTCPSIRCTRGAFPRSAASPAHGRSGPARTSARAVGGGSRRTARNAGCTAARGGRRGRRWHDRASVPSRCCSRPRASTSSARRPRSSAGRCCSIRSARTPPFCCTWRARRSIRPSRRSRCCTSTPPGSSAT